MRRTLISFILSAGIAGCAQYNDHSVPPLDSAARDKLGLVDVQMAETKGTDLIGSPSTDPAANAGDAARNTALLGLDVMCPPGACSPVSVVAGFLVLIVGTPIAAIGNAIGTSDEPTVDQIVADMKGVAGNDAWKIALHDAVSANIQRSWHSAHADDGTSPAALRLVLTGPALLVNDDDALPIMVVHAELQAGGTCTLDRIWRWNGAIDDFFDLGANGATKLKAQLDAGARSLAQAIVDDIFSDKARVTRYRDRTVALGLQRPLMQIVPGEYQNTIASWDNDAYKLGEGVPCGGPFGPATAEGDLSAPVTAG